VTHEATWTITYDNDVGPDDDGFWEWWNVTDGARSFKCDSKADAEFLLAALAQPAPTAEVALPAVSEEAERAAFDQWWIEPVGESRLIRCQQFECGADEARIIWHAARAQSAAKGDAP
jgi:hypothetical protein